MSRLSLVALALGASLVSACGEKPAPPPPPPTPPAAQPVAALPEGQYAVCAACHQANGLGLDTVPALKGSTVLNGPPEVPIAIVLAGLAGPYTADGKQFSSVMGGWAILSDADIATTLTYARGSWGNTAPPITPEEVAAVRAKVQSRTKPWTAEELAKATLK